MYRWFVLLFKYGSNDHTRDSFNKSSMLLVEIKDFNALIDNKPVLEQPVKNKQDAYGKLIEMLRNDDYTTENLLDLSYHQNYYELIDTGLSREKSINIPQQINFAGKLEEDDGATIFFNTKKQQKTILNFSLDSLTVTE